MAGLGLFQQGQKPGAAEPHTATVPSEQGLWALPLSFSVFWWGRTGDEVSLVLLGLPGHCSVSLDWMEKPSLLGNKLSVGVGVGSWRGVCDLSGWVLETLGRGCRSPHSRFRALMSVLMTQGA